MTRDDIIKMADSEARGQAHAAITALRQALEKPKYRRGDRLLCLETEEYCVIHISGTDRQYVKFPDGHVGQYTNQQVADHFELLPKEVDGRRHAESEGSMSREAMKLALEALEKVTKHFTRTHSTLMDSEARVEAHSAITALRQALEQPADLPVAEAGMTREDIIKMAREAGLVYGSDEKPLNSVTRFAALVAAAEREACAKVCDVLAVHPEYASDITKVAAQAIRARGEQ